MTLRNDIYNLFLMHKQLRPSQIQKELQKMPKYKDLDSRGLSVNISRMLANLHRDRHVKIVEEMHGKKVYELTKNGLKEASVKSKQSRIKSRIDSIDDDVLLELLDIFTLEYAWALHEARPKGMKIDLDVELDHLKNRVLEEIEKRKKSY